MIRTHSIDLDKKKIKHRAFSKHSLEFITIVN